MDAYAVARLHAVAELTRFATAAVKVVGYVRVSTVGQVADGLGLDVQRAAIIEWTDRLSHELIEVIADEGLSGTLQVHERPGLARVLDLVRVGAAEGIVVHRLDRLARTLIIQEAALAAVWTADGHVFEVTGGEVLRDDPADPMRTALRQVMGAFAQLERATLVARMAAGRRLKAERGQYAGGAPGFGWTAQERDLVVDPAEQQTLERVLELRRNGLSWRRIASVLDDEGRTPKRAVAWHPETLRRLALRASID